VRRGDRVASNGVPLDVEVPRAGIEEQVPSEVETAGLFAVGVAEQGTAEPVGSEDVHPTVGYVGRGVNQGRVKVVVQASELHECAKDELR
jgi:hypothetical protein